MYKVALTGGIGSGKSSASALFAALGVPIIDADVISHALTAPGGEALPAIAEAFGAELITADGALDRAALRRIVFADPAARRRLEAILHPRIRANMRADAEAAEGPYVILAIPLLLETGQTDLADRVLVIDLPRSQQIERVIARSGLDAAEVERIMASQVSRAERLAAADDIIDNSGPEEALRPQVEALHRRYLTLASEQ
jgi:dephospho-CoA kinase